jgi:hypothetical protein
MGQDEYHQGEEIMSDDTAPRKTGGTAGRFRTINNFLDYSAQYLTPTEALVWVLLWRDAREGLARTAQSYLASRAGVNVRTARRAVERLREVRLLTRKRQGGIGRGPSVYRIHPVPTEE